MYERVGRSNPKIIPYAARVIAITALSVALQVYSCQGLGFLDLDTDDTGWMEQNDDTPQGSRKAKKVFLGVSITIVALVIVAGCCAAREDAIILLTTIVVAMKLMDFMSDWAFVSIDLSADIIGHPNYPALDGLKAPATAFAVIGTFTAIIDIILTLGGTETQWIGGALCLFLEDLPQLIILLTYRKRLDAYMADPNGNFEFDSSVSGFSLAFTIAGLVIAVIKTCVGCMAAQ